jgi:hypothetical protein
MLSVGRNSGVSKASSTRRGRNGIRAAKWEHSSLREMLGMWAIGTKVRVERLGGSARSGT